MSTIRQAMKFGIKIHNALSIPLAPLDDYYEGLWSLDVQGVDALVKLKLCSAE